jgi:hypothetical protein
VQGYRPNDAGGFDLKDGVFLRFCNAARNDAKNDYVLITSVARNCRRVPSRESSRQLSDS